ncbi:D-glycero-beta-D-manno-heptose 1,7-bisphosphate 7-phosphatase [Sulfurovum riftiae]|uniref:D,D-heptose 1,7-bisphosphate phosphatase n=1 Tax=Sulfurovum riftiae TaxID=1630136 RepID=A0A151CFR7_9BACT|nr:D-glycero-beta-D-manno-heptose 1,7-bisphosphate 7-phosphatase [Sulfurovum riftiae]KYJ86314.1 D,D-heptose 1,7-bisphosphate phosphatase [Sulfurovum riftiae]
MDNLNYQPSFQKALFLDRDGIINVDHGYVSKIKDFEFVEGIFDLVKLFSKTGYLIFIVTNQSGIGRGYYSEEDFSRLTQWMKKKFQENGIQIEGIYYCPHAPDANCNCRKPKTGMIEEALKSYPLDLSASWVIGDKQSDIDLADAAHIGHSIAIGNRKIENAEYNFSSINECKRFLEENPAIINA